MTMRRLLLVVPLAGVLYFATGSSSSAESPRDDTKKGPNIAGQSDDKQKGDSSDDAVGQLALAHSLVKYGRQARSPQALITAAEILAKITPSALKDEPTTKEDPKPSDAPSQEKKRGQAGKLKPEALLQEAKQMAGDDPHLVATADRVARSVRQTSPSEKSRGAVGGPKYGDLRVPAYSTSNIRVNFRGGLPARVALSGDGDTDLDLYIYDESGNLIASDTDYSDDCVAEWCPKWTGPFLIRVRNRGSVYNDYVMITN